ncbi:MAG TPA: c-type cytochrome [Candidatus Dormibacteraeota bacterium]|nr:c-type cytochrome [Candidatus Dormibacteraeota bacterium]
MAETHEEVQSRRHPVVWLILALAALAVLSGVLAVQDRNILLRWSVFLSTDIEQGHAVFQEKGCVHCHAVNAVGGSIGPDLGEGKPSSVAFLVTTMWNHAPNMWAYMRAERFSYPTLDYEQTAQLVAYLYMASRMDAQGDAEQGRLLFAKYRCSQCHFVTATPGPHATPLDDPHALRSPMVWVQAMWNSTPAMEEATRKTGVAWPVLESSDLADLYAYVRSGLHDSSFPERFLGDPKKGWQLFQSKGCLDCHALRGDGPQSPGAWRSLTFMQVGQAMWSNAPAMLAAMKERGLASPRLTGKDLADLAAFIYTLRYFDPVGSAIVGRSVFRWRGCSHCHGREAQGSSIAPALRGQGRNYNSISLATALWSHGPKMFQRSQELGIGWPRLHASDVGDLLAFLNTPREQRRH